MVAEGYEIAIEDHRHGWEFDFEHVEQTSYDHVMWPPRHPHAGEPILLRDYQVDAINRFLDNPQCLQEIATGAGKTLITAVLSQKVEHLGRSMVIVPNKDSSNANRKGLQEFGSGCGRLLR